MSNIENICPQCMKELSPDQLVSGVHIECGAAFNEKDFEKPIIEKNDISVNMEELIHPKVFAEFATQKV